MFAQPLGRRYFVYLNGVQIYTSVPLHRRRVFGNDNWPRQLLIKFVTRFFFSWIRYNTSTGKHPLKHIVFNSLLSTHCLIALCPCLARQHESDHYLSGQNCWEGKHSTENNRMHWVRQHFVFSSEKWSLFLNERPLYGKSAACFSGLGTFESITFRHVWY